MKGLSPLQYERLMRPLNSSRVKKRDGMSYLEAWDVRAHLIRTFGFGGFSVTADEAEMVSHTEALQVHVELLIAGGLLVVGQRDLSASEVGVGVENLL